jgi:D-threo-aldose 1-dehydrogenase
MRSNRLGRTDVVVSELGFGAAPIGNLYTAIDDDTARATVDAAWAAGIRYFDTAPHYGLGLSERRLGAALAGHDRDQFSVSTKVGRLLVPNRTPTGSDLGAGGFAVPDDLVRTYDYSRDGVHRSLETSLSRLGLDRVDIVYIHDPEDHMAAAINQAVPALIELRDQGVVAAIGVGMNLVAPLLRFAEESDIDAIMVAGRWTLIDRTAQPLLDRCQERGIAVVAAAPFNSGLLAQPRPPDDAHFDYGPAPADVLAGARALAIACEQHAVTLPHAAVQFPLRHESVACVVTGMRTSDQVRHDIAWATDPLPERLWPALECIRTHS